MASLCMINVDYFCIIFLACICSGRLIYSSKISMECGVLATFYFCLVYYVFQQSLVKRKPCLQSRWFSNVNNYEWSCQPWSLKQVNLNAVSPRGWWILWKDGVYVRKIGNVTYVGMFCIIVYALYPDVTNAFFG